MIKTKQNTKLKRNKMEFLKKIWNKFSGWLFGYSDIEKKLNTLYNMRKFYECNAPAFAFQACDCVCRGCLFSKKKPLRRGLVAYIASPVSIYLKDDYNEGVKKAILHAKRVATKAKDCGYIPLSAPMAFLHIYDERFEREKAMSACFEILEKCDVLFYDQRDLHKSEGMRRELMFAKSKGIKIVPY